MTSTQNEMQSGIEINPTLWGYVIQGPCGERREADAGRALRLSAGIAATVLAAGLLFWSSFAADLGDLAIRLGATLFFGFLAVIMLWRAPGPVIREVQIEMNRGEVLAGYRDGEGNFTLDTQHGFEDVTGVLLLATGDKDLPAELVLRLDGREDALLVALGESTALEPLADRMARDLGAIMAGFDPVAASRTSHDRPLVLGPRIEVLSAA